MIVNNKNGIFVFCLLLALGALGGLRCMKGCDTGQPARGIFKARIVEIATNDLGQVMVFAEDAGKREMVFVKNFYSEGANSAKISADMQAYYNKIAHFRGRAASIRYHSDAVGDNIIDGIE